MGIPLRMYSVGHSYSGVWLGIMPYYGLIILRPYSQLFAAFYSGPKGQFTCVLGCPHSFFPVLPSQAESHLHLHPLPPDFFRPHLFQAGARALSRLLISKFRPPDSFLGFNDYGEFIAATVHLNKLEREEYLIAAFRYFNKDGSGYTTVDELQQACTEHNMTVVLLEDIIREVDQDNIVQQIQNMMIHDKSDRETVLVRRMLQDGLLDVVCLKH